MRSRSALSLTEVICFGSALVLVAFLFPMLTPMQRKVFSALILYLAAILLFCSTLHRRTPFARWIIWLSSWLNIPESTDVSLIRHSRWFAAGFFSLALEFSLEILVDSSVILKAPERLELVLLNTALVSLGVSLYYAIIKARET